MSAATIALVIVNMCGAIAIAYALGYRNGRRSAALPGDSK